MYNVFACLPFTFPVSGWRETLSGDPLRDRDHASAVGRVVCRLDSESSLSDERSVRAVGSSAELTPTLLEWKLHLLVA
eukprot:SAG31_NODE_8345_length_1469_cov_1.780292_2_plen_78_part_00